MTIWNAADASSNYVVSASGVYVTLNATTAGGIRGTTSKSTGKYYLEFSWSGNATSNANWAFGVANASAVFSNLATSSVNAAWVNVSGAIQSNGITRGSIPATYDTNLGGYMCMAVDLGAGLFWVRRSGSDLWNNNASANPATGVGGFGLVITGPFFPLLCNATQIVGASASLNFGASPFMFAIPAGFDGWDGHPTPIGGAVRVQGGGNTLYQVGTPPGLHSISYTLPAPVTSGNAILGSVAVWTDFTVTGATMTVTDDKGNTYNNVDIYTITPVAHNTLITFYLTNITNNPQTFTATLGPPSNAISSGWAILVDEFSGLGTATVDGHGMNQTGPMPGSGGNVSSPTVTATVGSELIWGTLFCVNYHPTVNAVSGFTMGTSVGYPGQSINTYPVNDVHSEYQQPAGAGSYAAGFGVSSWEATANAGSLYFITGVMTFRAVAGGVDAPTLMRDTEATLEEWATGAAVMQVTQAVIEEWGQTSGGNTWMLATEVVIEQWGPPVPVAGQAPTGVTAIILGL